MLGFVGLQPVELSVQRSEQVSRESRQMMTFALRDIQFAIAREAELELRVKRLEQRLEALETLETP